jgi:endonuclease/exonuclease/phosphatase family metal-dependent hydrolase
VRKSFIALARIAGFIALTLVLLILYAWVRDFRPPPLQTESIQASKQPTAPPDTFSVLIWNIGYAGLSADQDFFFDGGNAVRAPREIVLQNLQAIQDFLRENHSDFLLLQEVDIASKRSWYINQYEAIASAFPELAHSNTINYNSVFVPQPLTNPMGRVKSGLMNLGKYQPVSAERHALSPDAGFPTGMFMLKRCFLNWRFPLPDGKELLLINVHLSAYDDGSVKEEQLQTLRTFLLNEQSMGNRIVVGGDWNQRPPGYNPNLPDNHRVISVESPENYPDTGWNWAWMPEKTTNRWLNEPYRPGKTPETIIDYFLYSPGLELLELETIKLDFLHSDHEPVRATFVLSNP